MLDLGAMKHEITSKGCLRLLIKLTGTFSSFQATNKSKHEEVARDTPCRTERASTQSAPTSCKRMVVQQPTALISYYTFLLLLFFFPPYFHFHIRQPLSQGRKDSRGLSAPKTAVKWKLATALRCLGSRAALTNSLQLSK